jgi:two-component system sensor histidine kinase HydH
MRGDGTAHGGTVRLCYRENFDFHPLTARGGRSLREVCRSRPAYGTRLLFASALFTGLFVADVFLLAQLAFRSLGTQVVDRAFAESFDALEPRPGPVAPVLASDAPPGAATGSECLIDGPLSREDDIPCRQASSGPARPTGFFRALTVRIERALTDTRGRVLWRDVWQGSLPRDGGQTERHFEPDHQRVRETWVVDGQPVPVLVLRQPVGVATPSVVREIGIPEEQIEQELETLRGDLQRKIWIGALGAILILVIAFIYVLHLLHRTRLAEAQAQMDDRLAYVGGLAAGLAHEIRNPLNVLSMNLQMLEEDIAGRAGGEPTGDTKQYLGTLQGEIRRLSSLVDNFLSYARPSAPRFESRDLNQVVGATSQLVKPQFEAKGIALKEGAAPPLPSVDLDEGLIRQALMNILMNAAQILKPGGSVTVETGVAADGGVFVAVTDDGPGIPAADRERIFEVFYSSRPGGTGLGLPIAARILQVHGGRISVESGPAGRGARFVLRWPRRQRPEGAGVPAAAVART